jgi:lysozyme
MRISPPGVALIKHFESCALSAYPDPKTGGEPWTLGWGHTRGVKEGHTCTQEEADEMFDEDVGEFERVVLAAVRAPINQWQFDALTSFAYNVGPGRKGVKDGLVELKGGGPSTLLRRLNAGDYVAAADEFLRWVNPGSSVENGLRTRRTAERAMFLGLDWRRAIGV